MSIITITPTPSRTSRPASAMITQEKALDPLSLVFVVSGWAACWVVAAASEGGAGSASSLAFADDVAAALGRRVRLIVTDWPARASWVAWPTSKPLLVAPIRMVPGTIGLSGFGLKLNSPRELVAVSQRLLVVQDPPS